MKGILFKTAVAVAGLSGVAVAAVTPYSAHHNHAGGFSVALQGGYSTQNTNFEGKYVVGTTNRQSSSNMSGEGGLVGLNLGYDYAFKNKLVVGLTVHGELSSLKGKTSNNFPTVSDGYTELKQKHAFGAYARLGYVYHNVVPYIKLGYVNSRFEAESKDTLAGFGNATASKDLSGFQGGIGCEVLINRNWSVLGEYTYSIYERFSYDGRLRDNTKIADIELRPQTNAFVLKLKYRFGK
jgi:opacity protein-like surface antigen